jgi:arsenite-transporting ATPase
MQNKYLSQIKDLYDDFNVTIMPLQDEEVRGKEKLVQFGQLLLKPKPIPKAE